MDTVDCEFRQGREAFEATVRQRRIALRAGLEELFAAKPAGAVPVLEIGAGHGHFLTAYALEHPQHWALGIDIMSDRVRRAERKRERAGHENLGFLRCEAMEFLECLPATAAFRRVFVLFPDPWPKKRHHKNRLLAPLFFNAMAARMAPGGQLFFRTDYDSYFEQVRETVREHPQWDLQEIASLPFEEPTVFQQRAESFSSLAATLRPA